METKKNDAYFFYNVECVAKQLVWQIIREIQIQQRGGDTFGGVLLNRRVKTREERGKKKFEMQLGRFHGLHLKRMSVNTHAEKKTLRPKRYNFELYGGLKLDVLRFGASFFQTKS